MEARRQGAVPRRPVERSPLDRRHAGGNKPRRKRRQAIAKSLAERAGASMAVKVPGGLMPVASGTGAVEAQINGFAGVPEAPCNGDIARHRSKGLYGQRQREQQCCKPFALHQENLQTSHAQRACVINTSKIRAPRQAEFDPQLAGARLWNNRTWTSGRLERGGGCRRSKRDVVDRGDPVVAEDGSHLETVRETPAERL